MTTFFKDSWLLFLRHLKKTAREPMWLMIGLMQPVLYLLLYMPLLKNIPGANGATYSFFAPLSDNGRQIRLLFSAPGGNRTYTTLMHINVDTVAPVMLSASSLDGNTIGVRFSEPLDFPDPREALCLDPGMFVALPGLEMRTRFADKEHLAQLFIESVRGDHENAFFLLNPAEIEKI